MPYWEKLFSTGYRGSDGNLTISSSQSSAIVSILSAGTFFGALGAAPMGDFIGRRWGLIFSTGVFTLGVIFQTVATAIPLFLAGRFFAGFGVGLISALSEYFSILLHELPSAKKYTLISSSLPVRNGPEMDSRLYRWLISICYHGWPLVGRCGE
jgi:MFS family permease